MYKPKLYGAHHKRLLNFILSLWGLHSGQHLWQATSVELIRKYLLIRNISKYTKNICPFHFDWEWHLNAQLHQFHSLKDKAPQVYHFSCFACQGDASGFSQFLSEKQKKPLSLMDNFFCYIILLVLCLKYPFNWQLMDLCAEYEDWQIQKLSYLGTHKVPGVCP